MLSWSLCCQTQALNPLKFSAASLRLMALTCRAFIAAHTMPGWAPPENGGRACGSPPLSIWVDTVRAAVAAQ